ncbi:MAG: hypothetical protein J5701_06475, partial [Bacteroidales bacterium]|nr:hypothetical protein [Bacteroidales bacterium]
PLSNDLTALTFSLSECFDFFIFFGFSCYKITTFCPLLICPIFGEGYRIAAFGLPEDPSSVLAQDNIYRDTALSEASQVIDPIIAGINQGLDLAGELLSVISGKTWAKPGEAMSQRFVDDHQIIQHGKHKGEARTAWTYTAPAAYGNPQQNVPIEVEGGETAQLPNGQMLGFNGASHEYGGIDVDLPEGTEIYSQRLTRNGQTLADRKVEREEKMKRATQKVRDRVKEDKLAQNTLERLQMINDYQEAQDTAFQNGVRDLVSQIYGDDSGVYPKANAACGGRVKAVYGNKDFYPNSDDYNYYEEMVKKMVDSNPYNPGITSEAAEPNKGVVADFKDNNSYIPMSAVIPQRDENGEYVIPDEIVNYKYKFNNPTTPTDNNTKTPWYNQLLSSMTLGNMNVLAGNMFQGIAPYLTTLKQREGDMPNVNAWKNYNRDTLRTLNDAIDTYNRNRDTDLADLELNRRSMLNQARNSARGVNTLRALDNMISEQYQEGVDKINNSYNDIYMKLLGQIAANQTARDEKVMKGEEDRMLADIQDRDNFYRQLATDQAFTGQGIAQSGKDLNQQRQAMVALNNLNHLSKYPIEFDWLGRLVESLKKEAYGGKVKRTNKIRNCR